MLALGLSFPFPFPLAAFLTLLSSDLRSLRSSFLSAFAIAFITAASLNTGGEDTPTNREEEDDSQEEAPGITGEGMAIDPTRGSLDEVNAEG